MIKNTQHRCNVTFLLVAITVVLVASGVSLSVQAQDLVWAKRAGGSVTGGPQDSSEYGYDIAVLSDGSALVTGHFRGTATFGQGEPGETLLTSAGDEDIFVARYNPYGTLAWAKRAGGSDSDRGNGIAVLADGSSLVTGWFVGTATFGPGEPGETVFTSAGENIFVARYNPDGSLAWAKQAGGSRAWGRGIAVLADGSALVTGDFMGTATFGPGEPGETHLTSAGGREIFVARYNPDGTLAWAKRAGGTGGDEGYGIAVLADGSALVTGVFWSVTATFGPGEPGQTLLTSAGYGDIFVARYNPDGTLAWAKRAGGSDGEYGRGIAVLSDGSSLVTGIFNGTATFGPGEPGQTVLTSAGGWNIFMARYNPDGTLAWAKRAGGTGITGQAGGNHPGIAVLADGSSLVTSHFWGTDTFGPGEPGETTLTSAGGADIFVARYNPDGTLDWAKRAGGTGNDIGFGIAVLADGSALVTGTFSGTATFGPGEPGQTLLTSAGAFDIFVARYGLPPLTFARSDWTSYY